MNHPGERIDDEHNDARRSERAGKIIQGSDDLPDARGSHRWPGLGLEDAVTIRLTDLIALERNPDIRAPSLRWRFT
jgi:hypothetical protein